VVEMVEPQRQGGSGDVMQVTLQVPEDGTPVDLDPAFVSRRAFLRRRMAISSEPVDLTGLEDGDHHAAVPHTPKSPETLQALEAALSTNVLFAHLEEDERRQVFDAMAEVRFAAGDTIIQQGDEGDNFYVVDQGECEVWISKDGGLPQLRRLPM